MADDDWVAQVERHASVGHGPRGDSRRVRERGVGRCHHAFTSTPCGRGAPTAGTATELVGMATDT